MRFEALLDRHDGGELLQGGATDLLGVTERTLRLWQDPLRVLVAICGDRGPHLCDCGGWKRV